MSKLKVLVVEDERLGQKIMAKHLTGHLVEFAGDLAAAKQRLDAGRFDLCFIDLHLGEGDRPSGLELIRMAAEKGVYSVVMSSHDTEEMVVQAYELGCRDFYAKGNEQANIGAVLSKYHRDKAGFDSEDIFAGQFVTEDPATRASILEGVKYAASDLPIMILGPSGTGKTCLGKIIHEHSGREGEFVAINCAAYAENLLEAELFGHKEGAFTDATGSRKGKLAQAHKGTLFLDEIGAMSLDMQAKLLKAIEERTFYPVGSDKAETSEFRVISATLEDLQRLIAQGRLRFDFFQRIHGLTIKLKPLSERKCDILPLVRFFTRGGKHLSISQEAKACLLGHPWPGNARELRKVVELLAAGAEGRVTPEEVRRHLDHSATAWPAVPFIGEGHYRHALEMGLGKALDRFAREVIRRNLAENNGKKTKTMSALRISARRLYAALKEQEASDGIPA
ncbi:MAG: sigma-54 dependent transcriptional regulator [Elusimicrobiota bacterium]